MDQLIHSLVCLVYIIIMPIINIIKGNYIQVYTSAMFANANVALLF